MHVLAVANHKGGVGKTSTTHALGVAYSREGRRVLMVDCDPQASLTAATRATHHRPTLNDAMREKVITPELVAQAVLRLDDHLAVLPSCDRLAETAMIIQARMGRETVLRRLLKTIQGQFDLVILDCPPSLSVLTLNALTAADGVLVPTQAQCIDLMGLKSFLETIEAVRENLNPQLQLYGILPTFFDPRLIHHREAIKTMIDGQLPVMKSRVGRSIRVAEASSFGQSVLSFDPENPQSAAFISVAKEASPWLLPATSH